MRWSLDKISDVALSRQKCVFHVHCSGGILHTEFENGGRTALPNMLRVIDWMAQMAQMIEVKHTSRTFRLG